MNWETDFENPEQAEQFAAYAYRMERQATIQEWTATRTPQEAAGDHYERMMEVPGWAEAQPF